MLKKGQLGPQGLEDLPMAVMAFIAAVAAVIILMDVSSGHLSFSSADDMHNAGKRLAETLSGELFKSEESRSYGESVLDWDLVKELHQKDPMLRDLAGYLEYRFWARIHLESRALEFGEEPPEAALSYNNAVSALVGGSIYNGRVTIKIWPR